MTKAHLFQRLGTGLCLPLLAISLGCGRETKVYPDAAATSSQTNTTIIVDDRPDLPKGFYDQSANQAIVDVTLDGSNSASVAIRLQTNAVTNNTGGFNDASSTGNRAILGIGGYSGKHLDTLDKVTFDSKTYAGSEKPAVHLQVDLTCDGTAALVVLSADGSTLGSGDAQSSNYTRFTAGLHEAKWRALSASIAHPTDSSQTLVPSDTSVAAVSLDALLAAYPNACLKNGASGEASLPKGRPMAAVLIALGQASTTTLNGVFLNRVSVGSDVYSDLE
jgi:hypothetical protein